MRMKLSARRVPIWLALGLIVVLTSSVVYAASITTTTYTAINAEMVTLNEGNLNATPLGVSVAASTVAASGNMSMAAAGNTSNEALTAGNWVYQYKLEVAVADANQKYSVELKKDGTSQGILYVLQAAVPAVNDYVTLSWDLGGTLSGGAYVVEVKEVT